MSERLEGAGLATHCEMAVLRLLVESMLTAMPPTQQALALAEYTSRRERAFADLLAGEASEAILTGVQRAAEWTEYRLQQDGLEVPNPLRPSMEDPPT